MSMGLLEIIHTVWLGYWLSKQIDMLSSQIWGTMGGAVFGNRTKSELAPILTSLQTSGVELLSLYKSKYNIKIVMFLRNVLILYKLLIF